MFRFLISSLFLLPAFVFAQNSYTFGDKINVRKEPVLSSAKVCQLPAGHFVKVLEETEEFDTLLNRVDPWFKVEFDWKGNKELGWVWGGLITEDATVLPDGSLALMGFRVDDEDNLIHRILIVRSGEIVLDEDILSGHSGEEVREMGGVFYSCFTEIGMKGVKCVILLGAELSPCGYSADYRAFAWTGKELIHLVDYDEYGSEYDSDLSGELIFPTDSLGRADQIGFHSWLYDWNVEENREEILEESYKWYSLSGNSFIPVEE